MALIQRKTLCRRRSLAADVSSILVVGEAKPIGGANDVFRRVIVQRTIRISRLPPVALRGRTNRPVVSISRVSGRSLSGSVGVGWPCRSREGVKRLDVGLDVRLCDGIFESSRDFVEKV